MRYGMLLLLWITFGLAACGVAGLPGPTAGEGGAIETVFVKRDDGIVAPAAVASPTPLSRPTSAPATPTPGPTLRGGLTPTSLKYLLIEKFGGIGASGGIFYCDPDAYPVAVAGRAEAQALAQFSDIEKNSEEFQTILERHDLAGITNFSTEQKFLVYQEHKKLRVLNLELDGQAYKFQVHVLEEQGGFFAIEGTITSSGAIAILKREARPFHGCPICLAEETRIDTPEGPVAVQDLRPGLTVWTRDASGTRLPAVIVQTARVPAPAGHQLVRLLLDDGRELLASPGHPTADGRRLADLLPDDKLDGAHVVVVEHIPYEGPATYDLLPAGETGFYWADGVLIGSTLSSSGIGCHNQKASKRMAVPSGNAPG